MNTPVEPDTLANTVLAWTLAVNTPDVPEILPRNQSAATLPVKLAVAADIALVAEMLLPDTLPKNVAVVPDTLATTNGADISVKAWTLLAWMLPVITPDWK